MAEFGAHLTSAGLESQPSIFEVQAQEGLMTAIRPAWKHLAKVIAERSPSNFSWLYIYRDEVYTALDLILQQYYLKTHCASFAENFYGLKRLPVKGLKGPHLAGKGLPRREHILSLISLVLLPYIKLSLDGLFERLREEFADGKHATQNLFQKFTKAFLAVYPFLHMTHEGSKLTYTLMYIFGKHHNHSPYLDAAGVILQNLTEDDVIAMEAPVQQVVARSFSEKLKLLPAQAINFLVLSLSTSLSVGVFFLQFLEWWYAYDKGPNILTALVRPPPPDSGNAVDDVPKLPNVCPLCHRTRTNHTALTVSGYVFCYTCIYKYIKDNQTCPVTGYPAETKHLIKLYLPE